MLAFAPSSPSSIMYTQFFNLKQTPFSIAPDPRYLFMTNGHREALAHLMYGINSGGGIVLLTGEIGAGKTTVCRCFLEQVPPSCNVAYIFNPKLTVIELLQAICDEFSIGLKKENAEGVTVKDYVDVLTAHLLSSHAIGRNNVLIIDEAQNLSADVLEQLRLLTNLETNERKLLQIILIGQPELRAILENSELEQLAQRVIARYHLTALSEGETASYIQHRLSVAGLMTAPPFSPKLIKQIHQFTKGVPRRINVLCDRALLGAYAENKHSVDRAILQKAAKEIYASEKPGKVRTPKKQTKWLRYAMTGLAVTVVLGSLTGWALQRHGYAVDTFAWKKLPIATTTTRVNKSTSVTKKISTAPANYPVNPVAAVNPAANVASALPPPEGLKASLRAAASDEDNAYRALALAWGLSPLPAGKTCEIVRDGGLYCVKSADGLRELRQIDRPAILTLHDDNNTYHVLLTNLTEKDATVHAGKESQTLSLSELGRYFRGHFVTFWRAPRVFRTPLRLGDRNSDVDWAATQLAKLNKEEEPAPRHLFDEKMAQQVREFQSSQGLNADGLIGPTTFMYLNRAATLNDPRLQHHLAGLAATVTAN